MDYTDGDQVPYHPERPPGISEPCQYQIPVIPVTPARPDKPLKPLYCATEKNYLKFKRTNDPCSKLTVRIPIPLKEVAAKDRFRAVLAQQKLQRIINARLTVQPNHRRDLFHDLLPNETNIAIQMGAIAGYYGETVVEDDLIQFFGKLLPMYKPISDVVDSITPSISHKIQASNFVWRNQTELEPEPPRYQSITNVPMNDEPMVSVKDEVDLSDEVTFEYVSFREQVSVDVQPELNSTTINNHLTATAFDGEEGIIVAPERPSSPEFMDVVTDNSSSVKLESIIISQENCSNEYLKQESGEEVTMEHRTPPGYQQHHVEMAQFSNNLLDSNYYDSSAHDFGLELKTAIDLIMN